MSSILTPTPEQIHSFEKSIVAMRHWLLGRIAASRYASSSSSVSWETAAQCFSFALQIHTGHRKDGNPEMIHQIRVAHFLRTLEPHLQNAPLVICAAMLHDIREDYGISHHELASRFGSQVADCVEKLTKSYQNNRKDDEAYYHDLSLDPEGSIVKAADRFHNHSSMSEAFSISKQLLYLDETELLVLPMIKKASRHFPLQEGAYENIKLALKSHISMTRPILLKLQQLSA